jgi:hypothetical protein
MPEAPIERPLATLLAIPFLPVFQVITPRLNERR